VGSLGTSPGTIGVKENRRRKQQKGIGLGYWEVE